VDQYSNNPYWENNLTEAVSPDHSYARQTSSRRCAEANKTRVFFRVNHNTDKDCEYEDITGKVIKYLKDSDFEYAAFNILKIPPLRQALERQMLYNIDTICDGLCSKVRLPGPSVLGMMSISEMCSKDIVAEAYMELKRCLPFVFDILHVMSNSLMKKGPAPIEMISMIYGMLMKIRNSRLGAMQRVLTTTAIHLKAETEVL
jgi:hypothetical protein